MLLFAVGIIIGLPGNPRKDGEMAGVWFRVRRREKAEDRAEGRATFRVAGGKRERVGDLHGRGKTRAGGRGWGGGKGG